MVGGSELTAYWVSSHAKTRFNREWLDGLWLLKHTIQGADDIRQDIESVTP